MPGGVLCKTPWKFICYAEVPNRCACLRFPRCFLPTPMIGDDAKSPPGGCPVPCRTIWQHLQLRWFAHAYYLMYVSALGSWPLTRGGPCLRSILDVLHHRNCHGVHFFEEQVVKCVPRLSDAAVVCWQGSFQLKASVRITIIVTCPDWLNYKIPALLNFLQCSHFQIWLSSSCRNMASVFSSRFCPGGNGYKRL